LLRYNALSNLVDQADLVALLQRSGTTDGAVVVDHLARAFLCVPLSDAKRKELIRFLGELPPPDQWASQRAALNGRLRAVLVALVSLPEFQLAQAHPVAAPPALQLAAVFSP
jgi:hypothetical protein